MQPEEAAQLWMEYIEPLTALFKTIGRPLKNTRTGGLQILPILEARQARLRIRLRQRLCTLSW